MTGGYVSWSGALIRRWGFSLLLLLGISVVSVGMGRQLPASFIPEEDQGYAFLQIQLPDAASLQRTDAVMRKIDDMLTHTHGVRASAGSLALVFYPTPRLPIPVFIFFSWSLGMIA